MFIWARGVRELSQVDNKFVIIMLITFPKWKMGWWQGGETLFSPKFSVMFFLLSFVPLPDLSMRISS